MSGLEMRTEEVFGVEMLVAPLAIRMSHALGVVVFQTSIVRKNLRPRVNEK